MFTQVFILNQITEDKIQMFFIMKCFSLDMATTNQELTGCHIQNKEKDHLL